MKIVLSTLVAIIVSVSICLFLKEEKNTIPAKKIDSLTQSDNLEKLQIFKTKESLDDIPKNSILPIKDIVKIKDTDKTVALTEIEIINKVYNRTLADIENEIENIPSCIENVQNKADALACTKTFTLLQGSLALTLGLDTNYTMQYQASSWDDEAKSKILDEIEVISANNETLKMCLIKAKTKTEKGECLTDF